MKSFPLACILILTLALMACAQNGAQMQETLALTHVNVIDMTGAPLRPDTTVIIKGGRITAVGPSTGVVVPKSAHVIDATGKFLIPGLWDMHVHLNYESAREVEETLFPLFIANGVTGLRDMWNIHSLKSFRQINEWRDKIAKGKLIGPRLAAVGRGVDGPGGGDAFIKVKDAREARAAVRLIRAQGFDFVKVYSNLSREAFFAIADEAKQQHIAIAGHVPFTVSVAEASDAGLKSIEHLTEMLTSSSRDEEDLRRESLELVGKYAALSHGPEPKALMLDEVHLVDKALAGYDEAKAQRLFARFKRNDTYQCPTLVIFRQWANANQPDIFHDPREKYVPLSQRRKDALQLDAMRVWPAEKIANRKKFYQHQLEVTGAMQRAGVSLLAGTDATGTYPLPAFSLHDELAQLVLAGLTTSEALRAATYNPARYLGLQDWFGTVETGKLADLVLLEANPLEDISNTKRIEAVITNGRYYSKESLQKVLSKVEGAASRL